MAKLDNIVNSKFFFICEKNKESSSIKSQVIQDSLLDDEYLEKIKKTLNKKKAPLETTQGVELSQTWKQECAVFEQRLPARRSLEVTSPKSSGTAVLLMVSESTASRNARVQNRERRGAVCPAEDYFALKINRQKGITSEFSSTTLSAQEQKKHAQESLLSVKSSVDFETPRSIHKKDKDNEVSRISLSLESHIPAEIKSAPTLKSPMQPAPMAMRTPFNLPENSQVTSEKTLISVGDNGMIYHFNKWPGSNSVRVQWDKKDTHQVYLAPSNTDVLHHISDHIKALPSKLKVVLQEEQRHSRQGDPNENRENRKGKK